MIAILSALALAVAPQVLRQQDDVARACEQLSYDYAAAVDGNDPDALALLFTDDGKWQLAAAPMLGREAIRAYLVDFVACKTARSLHVTTNVRIRQTGPDAASGTAHVLIYSLAAGDKAGPPRGIGIYRDSFRRTADGWRFSERVLERLTF